MKCINPVLCYIDIKGNRRFKHFNFAKKQIVANLFPRHIPFSCGTCLFCRKKRAHELAIRCVLHASLYDNNCFITLTYDEKKENYHNDFNYPDIQKFKKRLRAYAYRTYGQRVEIFNVHEYGRNGKKHWHLILFGHDFGDKKIHTQTSAGPLYTSQKLGQLWPHGFNTLGDVSTASAMYQAQYSQKDFKNGHAGTLKKSHSRHSGLGGPYFLKHYKQLLTLGYIPFSGQKIPLPRYFQRLAHKHYAHFYDPSAFHDTLIRKAKHRPFKNNEQNQEIADLYATFIETKRQFILDLEKEYDEVISQYLTTKREPDFIQSGKNKLHDLKNQPNKGHF